MDWVPIDMSTGREIIGVPHPGSEKYIFLSINSFPTTTERKKVSGDLRRGLVSSGILGLGSFPLNYIRVQKFFTQNSPERNTKRTVYS